jgi:hypothetical protein
MAILQFDGLDHYGAGSILAANAIRTAFLANGFTPPAVRATTLGTAYGKVTGSLGALLNSAISTDVNPVWISKPIQPEHSLDVNHTYNR